MWFYENVTRAPVAEMAKRLSSTSDVRYVHSSPEHLGFPERRPRVHMCGINHHKCVWVGPTQSSFAAALQAFRGRSCELTGDAFCVAPEADVYDMVRVMARKHNTTLPLGWQGKQMTEYMTELLPSGSIDRLAEYEHENSQQLAANVHGIGVCDLEHHPESRGPVAGALWPATLTHHQMYVFSLKRLATPGESFAAQGFDWFPEVAGGRCITPLKAIVEGLPYRHQKMLVGNSMHVPSIMSFMLFCFAHIRKKDDLQKLPRPVTGIGMAADDTDSEA